MQGQLVISPDVMKALRENTAVVALESTIISHGMPYPQVTKLNICIVTAHQVTTKQICCSRDCAPHSK